jgi:kinetochore protein Mis13/DSN1
MLSDWFSRDDEPQQQVALRKKPNPRNIANAAKAIELERELERYGSTNPYIAKESC